MKIQYQGVSQASLRLLHEKPITLTSRTSGYPVPARFHAFSRNL
jgi:hypothetical protein